MGSSGATTVDVPPPTAGQTEYQNLTNEVLQQQLSDEQGMTPLLLNSMGYTEGTPTYTTDQQNQINGIDSQISALQGDLATPPTETNPTTYSTGYGSYTLPGSGTSTVDTAGITSQIAALQGQLGDIQPSTSYEPMTQSQLLASENPTQQLETQVQQATATQELSALNGTMPIDPALQQTLNLNDQATNERLAQQLGPDWQSSTAGTNAEQMQNQSDAITEEEARRGDISTLAGINNSNQQTQTQAQEANVSNINSFDTRYLPMIGAYTEAQQPLQAQQGMQFGANEENAQLSNSNTSGIMSMMGMLGGAGMGALSNYLKPAATLVGSGGG